MRRGRTRFLLLAALACAWSVGSSAQQENPDAKFHVVLDSSLTADKSTVQDSAAWLVYATDKIAQRSVAGVPERPLQDYGIELHARTQLAQYWQQEGRKKAKQKNAYLDKLVEINEAGFLPEYVLTALARPGWTLTADELRALRLEAFTDWAKRRLRGFVSVTLADVQAQQGSDAGPPGSTLPDPRLYAPGRMACGMALPPLRTALDQWSAEAAALRGAPLGAASTDEFVATVADIRTEEPYRSNGVTWVLPQPGLFGYYAGYCAVETGDLASAKRWLSEAIVILPRAFAVRQELIHVMVFEGRLDEADAQVERILARAQDRCDLGRAWRRRGYIRIEQQRWSDARTAYQRSLDFDPDSALARSELDLIQQNTKAGGDGQLSSYVPSQTFTTRCAE